ncbi:MAG: KTSC domain-containing protein [Pseudomonadota bacterium]
MERKKLSSGNLKAAGYDERSQTLEIEFTNGTVIQYARVSPEVHRRLMSSGSASSYFRDNIEDEYTARRVR